MFRFREFLDCVNSDGATRLIVVGIFVFSVFFLPAKAEAVLMGLFGLLQLNGKK